MPQFKLSKSMSVSRMECQMEWLSIGDVTVAVTASLGDNCLLSSFIRLKVASAPPHCCKVWMSLVTMACLIVASSSVSALAS